MTTATAFFKRFSDSKDNEGVFTLNINRKEVVKRLPCRTGLPGIKDPWLRGKGPIPMGTFLIHLTPVHNGSILPKGGKGRYGIGLFYPISSSPTNRSLIIRPGTPDIYREHIGFHGENDNVGGAKGSNGCIVGLWNNPQRKDQLLYLYDQFDWLLDRGISRIKLLSWEGPRD